MIKILLGGSPCTYWSIAQKNNRETEPSGMGWELFKNFLIAKEKFKPDYFLYENNVSAAQPIKDEIKKQLGVWDGTFFTAQSNVRYIEINSALVGAQNRKRFYVHNCGEVGQPKDRGILLKDVFGTAWNLIDNEKSYALTTRCVGAIPTEPIRVGAMPRPNGEQSTKCGAACILTKGKGRVLIANGGGPRAKTGLYAFPLNTTENDKAHTIKAQYYKNSIANFITNKGFDASAVAESVTGKTVAECISDSKPPKAYCCADGKIHTVYEVKDGEITIKGKQYPIKLPNGFYIIRKLTIPECRRLQTIPCWYKMPCSDSQNYKMLGNGWTIEVIKHILSYIPEIAKGEPIEVLSMYDGMSCGQIALKELGANVIRYYATEIDKYAIQTTQANFPNTIQLGDAFQVRNAEWGLGGIK